MVGKNQDKVRDKKILNLLAGGKSVITVAKKLRITPSRTLDRKKLQCAAIWNRVREMTPPTEAHVILRGAA